MRQLDRAGGRIERREKEVLGENLRGRHAVEERRLAGVGVADERDDRVGHAPAAFAMKAAGAGHRLEIALDARHALLNEPPIGLDLRLSGTAEEAEAAAL